MKDNRLHGPDVLRGFAAIGVVMFHMLFLAGIPIHSVSATLVGRFDFFVRIFFVLSAFSMAYAYHNKLNSIEQLRNFYVKRFFRIAPLFYFVLAFGVGYSLLMGGQAPDFYDLLLSLTFLFPFVPGKHGSLLGGGWSIGVEWMFYACFPLLLAFVRNYRLAAVAWVVFCSIAVYGRDYFSSYVGGQMREYGLLFFLSHLQYFIVGITVFYMFNSKPRDVGGYRKELNGSLLLITIGLTIIYFRFPSFAAEEVALSLSGFILVYLAASGLPVWLDNRLTRWLGLVSYSIYLVQFPIIHLLNGHGFYSRVMFFFGKGLVGYLVCSVITVIIVVAVSGLTYRWIEVPGKRLVFRGTEGLRLKVAQ